MKQLVVYYVPTYMPVSKLTYKRHKNQIELHANFRYDKTTLNVKSKYSNTTIYNDFHLIELIV